MSYSLKDSAVWRRPSTSDAFAFHVETNECEVKLVFQTLGFEFGAASAGGGTSVLQLRLDATDIAGVLGELAKVPGGARMLAVAAATAAQGQERVLREIEQGVRQLAQEDASTLAECVELVEDLVSASLGDEEEPEPRPAPTGNLTGNLT